MAAGMERIYEIVFKLKDQVSGDLKKVIDQTQKVDKSVKNCTDNMSKSFMGVKTSVLAYTAALTAVVYAVKKFADAAIEAQYVDQKLADTMKRAGTYSTANYKNLLDYADALQHATGIEDEEIKKNMKLAMSLGVVGDNIKWVGARSLDMAKKYEEAGMTSDMATRLLSKGLQGNFELLGRYIIPLRKVNLEAAGFKTKQEQNAEVVRILNKELNGQAQDLDTWREQLQLAETELDAVKELIGVELIKSILNLDDDLQKNKKTILEWGIIGVNVGEVIAKSINLIVTSFKGWMQVIDTQDLGIKKITLTWLKLDLAVQRVIAAYYKVTAPLNDEKQREVLESTAEIQQQIVWNLEDQEDLKGRIANRNKEIETGEKGIATAAAEARKGLEEALKGGPKVLDAKSQAGTKLTAEETKALQDIIDKEKKENEERLKLALGITDKIKAATLDETNYKIYQLDVWYEEQQKELEEHFKDKKELDEQMRNLNDSYFYQALKIGEESEKAHQESNNKIRDMEEDLQSQLNDLTMSRVDFGISEDERERDRSIETLQEAFDERKRLGLDEKDDAQKLANIKLQIEAKTLVKIKKSMKDWANDDADIYRDQIKVFGSYLEGMGVGWDEYWEKVAKTGEQAAQMMETILGGLHDVITKTVFATLKGDMIDFKSYWKDYWDSILKVYAEQQSDNFMKHLMKAVKDSDLLESLGLGDIMESAEKARKSPSLQALDEHTELLKEIRNILKQEYGVVEPTKEEMAAVTDSVPKGWWSKIETFVKSFTAPESKTTSSTIGDVFKGLFGTENGQQGAKQYQENTGKGIGAEIVGFFQQKFGGGVAQGQLSVAGEYPDYAGGYSYAGGAGEAGATVLAGAAGQGGGANYLGLAMNAYELYQNYKTGGGGTGGMISGAMSGAQLGMQVGSMFGGYGAVIGGVAGAVGGGVLGALGGGDEKSKKEKRVEKFKEAFSKWMDREYDTLTSMITAWPSEMRSKKGLSAAGGAKFPILFPLFDQMNKLADQAQTFGQTSVTAFQGFQNSLKAVALGFPELADEMEKCHEKMKKAFEAEVLAKFEEGTYSVGKALRQLERSGLTPVEARVKLLGEEWNQLTLALGGTIDAASDGAEFFGALDDVLDEMMEDFSNMPKTMNETKAELMGIVYVIQVLTTTISTFIYFMEDMAEFPEILADLDKAIKEEDWGKAADEVARLSDAFMSAASAMAEMVARLEEVGAAGAAKALSNIFEPWMKVFYTIGLILGLIEAIFNLMGMGEEATELFNKIWLGVLVAVQDVFEFIKAIVDVLASMPIIGDLFKPAQEDLQDIIDNLQNMIEELQALIASTTDAMSLYDYWEDTIKNMAKADLVKPILDAVRMWQVAIDDINLGPVKVQMKSILEDLLYARMMLVEALDEGVLGENAKANQEAYDKAMEMSKLAIEKAINDYFDVLTDAFEDFRYDLQKEIKGLVLEGVLVDLKIADSVEEIGTAAERIGKVFDTMISDVEKRMMKVMKDMTSETAKSWADLVKFTDEMDPQEYLDKAGELRDLIVERYDLEKQKIEETLRSQVDALEELEGTWKSLYETIDDILLALETSNASPQDIEARLAIQGKEVEERRKKYLEATGVERAEEAAKLVEALQAQLNLGQEAYQRPSAEYQALFDTITAELEALRAEAQTEYTKAESAIIDLLGESRDIDKKVEELTKPYREETIAQLEALDDQIEAANKVLEDMRDEFLKHIGDSIDELKKFLTEELTWTVQGPREKKNFTEALADKTNPTWDVVTEIQSSNDLMGLQTAELKLQNSRLMDQTAILNMIQLNTLWGKNLPKFDEGTDYVSHTMPAIVHKGETIIPAGFSRSTGLEPSNRSQRSVLVTINLGGINVSGVKDEDKKVAKNISEGIMREIKYGRLGDVIEERVRKAG